MLLDNGARADTPDYASQTALHMAAEGGHTGVVQLLLDKGARRDARDHLRRTPLLLACELKRESVIAMFAKERLDFSFRDGKGRNAWQMALHPSHYCNPCDHGPSQSTFDLIMQSFWAAENPQTMPLPKQRRAIVSFEMEIDTDWTALTLDSRYARFEHPRPLPSHVIDMFGRFIKVCPPAESIESLKSTIEFHVIYACETLDFSTAHEGRDFPRSVDRLLDSAFVAGGDSWHQAAKEFLFKTIRTSRPIRTPKRYLEHSDTGVSAFYTVTREACNEAFRAKSISLHIIPSKDQY